MSRIETVFAGLKASGRTALIPFITGGDPHPDCTVGLMHALVEAGADILEIGVPFSDPMADGPVVQLACERALRHGTSLRMVIQMVAKFREQNQETPVVLMGYLNPIEAYGLESFASAARAAGVDGVLVVDLAVEEAPEFSPVLRAAGLDCIFLLAPTSPPSRIRAAAKIAAGYLYYVSLKGVTGASGLDIDSVSSKVSEIRGLTDLPLAVGFGIRDAQSAAAVAQVADGVVVGSALVSEIDRLQKEPEKLELALKNKLLPLRQAMDAAWVS